MNIIAKTTVRIAPRKVRFVADSVRKLALPEALRALSVMEKRGATPISKTLRSAIANAKNNNNLKEEDLKLRSIDVLEAPSFKRFHASTRGRVHPYKRKGSHITVVLTDNKNQTKLAITSGKTEEKQEEKKGEKNGTKS